MLSCWQEDVTKRPTFNVLKSKFDGILSQGSQTYVDFSINPDKLCYTMEGDESDFPKSNGLLRTPSPRNEGPKLPNSRSCELVSCDLSPQGSPNYHQRQLVHANGKAGFTHSPSAERLQPGAASTQLFPVDNEQSKRPSSMFLLPHYSHGQGSGKKLEKLKKEGEEEERRDDRYVRDPSALLAFPNKSDCEIDRKEQDQRIAGSNDGMLHLRSAASTPGASS